MDNQHKMIKGYRDLDKDEIAAMNVIKSRAEVIKELVEDIGNLPGTDGRWVQIAEDHLQQGFMALTRAVAKPTTF
ncbi:hypothetical protein PHG25p104nc [Aeromonas phage 25]|uniref:Acb2/Tad1 hairpin domain-containing protein n=1 Tax=Aeromonas phage 25 TaxID=2911441 RepID=Q19CR3_9CAUD|nr:hypothetical protein PHG25p104nc [Aeromonas phage 25]ABF72662.1 hypothetical protein PHG25p104nc [Aeromonas phage 25]